MIAFAYRLGATRLHHYDDTATGTLSVSKRPGMSRLIEDIRLSRIEMVVAASLDRVSRLGEDIDEIAAVLFGADVPLHTLEQGRIHVAECREGVGDRCKYEMGWFNIPATGLSEDG